MKTVNVSELSGAALDWATGVSLGYKVQHSNNVGGLSISEPYSKHDRCVWSPSTDWSQGGPVLESNNVFVLRNAPYGWLAGASKLLSAGGDPIISCGLMIPGDTYLEAGMRVVVALLLGHELDVPDELCGVSV